MKVYLKVRHGKDTAPVSKGIIPLENSILFTTTPINIHNGLKK